jgi:hypothetical protein
MEDDGIKSKAIQKNMGRKKTTIKKRRCTINGKNINNEKNLCIVRVYSAMQLPTLPLFFLHYNLLIFFLIADYK